MAVKLSHQAAILICVPLLAELIILVFLLDALDKAALKTQRVNHAKVVQSSINETIGAPIQALSALGCYATTHAPGFEKDYTAKLDSIPTSLSRLKHLVSNNPQQMDAYGKLKESIEKLVVLLRKMRLALRPDGEGFSYLSYAETQNLAHSLSTAAAEYGREILKVEAESIGLQANPEENADYRTYTQLRTAVLGGIILSILIAVVLAAFFYQSTHKRLEYIVDNTKRLSEHEALRPLLDGEDELANLDRFFHQMASALDEARRKETAIVDNAVDVICSLDWNENFTAINPAALELWGFEPEDLIGKSITTVLPEEEQKSFSRELDTAKSVDAKRSFESVVKKKDGSIAHMLWSIYNSIEQRSIFCVVHDITDRKEVERLQADFISMVSHDLRTPLTAVRLFLDLLRDGLYGSISDSGLKKIDKVDDTIDRLVTLVSNLLYLDKLEAGGLVIYPQPTSLEKVVGRSIEAVSGLSHEFKVTVEFDRNGDVDLVVDEDRVVQVIVNLVSNAIKFSPPESKVTIISEETAERIFVKIVDRGPGISKQYQETIFERFRQSPDSSTEKKKLGSGLGLHIAQTLIELHGGEIGVESELGEGSTFWFNIPKSAMPLS